MSEYTGSVVIGLIGGICAGKSTITKILASKGAHVIDADKMGHMAYAKGTACLQALVDHFGAAIVDPSSGEVNRRVLGGIVFSDPDQMAALNRIVWPAIRVLLQEEITRVRQSQSQNEVSEGGLNGRGVIVVEAAVLLEAGWTDLVQEVWAVEVEPATSISRLVQRSKEGGRVLSEEQARQRVEAQLSNQQRREAPGVTHVFDNNPPAEEGGEGQERGVPSALQEEVEAALGKATLRAA